MQEMQQTSPCGNIEGRRESDSRLQKMRRFDRLIVDGQIFGNKE
jgi:hypothetical protein